METLMLIAESDPMGWPAAFTTAVSSLVFGAIMWKLLS